MTGAIANTRPGLCLGEGMWRPAVGIKRSFVAHRLDNAAPPQVWHVPAVGGKLVLSVIIPTADADRGGYFARLLQDIAAQDFSDYELIVVKGDPRQGRAINIGAALARGKYLLTLDDDSSLPDFHTFAKLVAAMDAHADIGMAGGANTIPADATPFVQRAMRQIPRRSWEPVGKITDSDLAEHPCLIMRADAFRGVGGENELLPRGLDPYLRRQFRQAGWRVVIVPGVIYHHLPPDTWGKLVRQFFRNGRHAAFVNRHHPEWVIETPAHHGLFVERRPLWRRLLRYPARMAASLFKGQWVWTICQACYAAGFVYAMAKFDDSKE